jgi:hypothetical protein
VLASRNISYEAAAMISKAIERKAVVMLQMLFSAINITDADTGLEYLSKFHTNLDTGKLSVDKFIDTMDTFVEENSLNSEASQRELYEKVKRDMKGMNFYLESNITDDSLESYKVVNVEGAQLLVHEDFPSRVDKNGKKNPDAFGTNPDRDKAEIISKMHNTYKTDQDVATHKLLDGDVKKANELVPTMMYVNFVKVSDGTDAKFAIPTGMVIGIKAKLYAIDSQDIMNRLQIKYNDKNVVLNLVKAGTQEISFARDFLFAIDRAKIDALSQSRRGSSSNIWKVLERRAIKSKLRRTMFSTNDASAITTLVISKEEVEYLKKTQYIDVENPKTIGPIMDSYNLMAFVIVDESLEIAKFLFDTGDDMYETVTFNNLEREMRDNTNKIINLMSKMSR